jgi:N-acetyl-beta-hexosaminidase
MFRWENWWERAPSVVPIQLEPSDRVIGGQMCAWEQTDVMEIPSLRRRLPAMSERIWGPALGRGFADFEARLAATDHLLQKLIRPAAFELQGLIDPGYEGSRFNRENRFRETLTVKMKPLREDDVIRFTTDGSKPTSDSARYEASLELNDSTSLVVQVLDTEGRARGFPWRTNFELHPIQVVIDGLIEKSSTDPAHVPGEFRERVTVTLSSSLEKGQINYTLDGQPPSLSSPVYESPLILHDSATVKAQFFDERGQAKGESWERVFTRAEL